MTSPVSEALAKLRRQFADQLPSRLDAIRAHCARLTLAAWQPAEVEALHRLTHSLTGTAGTFGMQSVSDASRELETLVAATLKSNTPPNDAAWLAIRIAFERLNQAARVPLETGGPSLKPPVAPQRDSRSPLIYLMEDDPMQAGYLGQAMRDGGYRVSEFTDTTQFRAAVQAVDAERPAIVVMDLVLPEGENAGAALIAELKLGKESGVPVIVVSIRDDLPARLAAFRAGASRYLVKPAETSALVDVLDSLTKRQPVQPYRVLLVDDDPLLLETANTVLRWAGMEVRMLSQPLQFLDVVDEFAPDVVVLDVYMPDASGPELAAVLRERDAQEHLPILFMSAETDMTQQLRALNLGGDDFLVKPVQPAHLVAAVTARARRARQSSAVRQRLETTLYEREREHLAVDHHAIVSIADRSGNITYVNDRFCTVSGYSRAELMGLNHRILKSDAHLPEFYQNLWRTIASGEVWQGEICNRRKDGSAYWVASTITPFLGADGKPYQFVSIRTDITHAKTTEAALRASESRLNFLVASSPVTIYTCSATPLFGATYVSPNIKTLTGYEPEQFTQDREFWANNIDPADRQRILDALPQVFERGEHEHQYRFRMPDGSYRWMHDVLRLIRNEAGESLELIGYWADVTESKRAEQALIAARDEAERANQAKSAFLSNMSHELRTPMNAILGFGQLMEYDDTLPAEHIESVKEISRAGQHLLKLINEILDLAKVESGRIQLSFEAVEVRSMVEECVSLVAALADQNRIRISYSQLQSAIVRADRTRLKQALLNLLSNAVKYNRAGGSVHLSLQPVGTERLQIRVTDTGLGIPTERIEELFQPFNRLGAHNSQIEGTGIGLSITRSIVGMMGGTVAVESAVGIGSTFLIELPLDAECEMEEAVLMD